MMLNIVLADEMGDRGRIVEGGIATPVHGRVDEMADFVFESCVDQALALPFFGVVL